MRDRVSVVVILFVLGLIVVETVEAGRFRHRRSTRRTSTCTTCNVGAISAGPNDQILCRAQLKLELQSGGTTTHYIYEAHECLGTGEGECNETAQSVTISFDAEQQDLLGCANCSGCQNLSNIWGPRKYTDWPYVHTSVAAHGVPLDLTPVAGSSTSSQLIWYREGNNEQNQKIHVRLYTIDLGSKTEKIGVPVSQEGGDQVTWVENLNQAEANKVHKIELNSQVYKVLVEN